MARTAAVITLFAIEALAIQSMWILMLRNGYSDVLKNIIEVGPQHLPLTQEPLMTKYIGVPPVDWFLTILQLFFANVADGKQEGGSLLLKLFVLQFVGTLGAIVLLIGIEGAKRGGGVKDMLLVMFTGLIIQIYGYGIAMPLYCAYHLYSNFNTFPKLPLSSSSVSALKALPLSLIIGYIIPTILMCLPVFSSWTHQKWVAVWQFFPIWVFIIQIKYSTFYKRFFNAAPATTARAARGSLNAAYLFAVFFGALTHYATLILTFGPAYLPQLFPDEMTSKPKPDWHDIFVPMQPFSSTKITDVTQGPLYFLQYDEYVGSLAVGFWALVLNTSAPQGKSFVLQLVKLLLLAILVGPGAAIVLIMWEKDSTYLKSGEAVPLLKGNTGARSSGKANSASSGKTKAKGKKTA